MRWSTSHVLCRQKGSSPTKLIVHLAENICIVTKQLEQLNRRSKKVLGQGRRYCCSLWTVPSFQIGIFLEKWTGTNHLLLRVQQEPGPANNYNVKPNGIRCSRQWRHGRRARSVPFAFTSLEQRGGKFARWSFPLPRSPFPFACNSSTSGSSED